MRRCVLPSAEVCAVVGMLFLPGVAIRPAHPSIAAKRVSSRHRMQSFVIDPGSSD